MLTGLLNVTVKHGLIVISSKTGNASLHLVGTNLPHSHIPNGKHNMLSFGVPNGERGVIALMYDMRSPATYLLPIQKNESGLWLVDLDGVFMEAPTGVLYNFSQEVISVQVGDENFGCWPQSADRLHGMRRTAADDICRYLAGDIDLDALRAAAEEVEAEKSARDQLAHLRADLAESQEAQQTLRDELREEQNQHIITRSALSIARADLIGAKNKIEELRAEALRFQALFIEAQEDARKFLDCAATFMMGVNDDGEPFDQSVLLSAVDAYKALRNEVDSRQAARLANEKARSEREATDASTERHPEMELHGESAVGEDNQEG